MPHIPKAIWAAVFLAAALLVILRSTGTDDPNEASAMRETLEYKLVPWPVIDSAMREAFDRAAKKTLYREDCRCLIWVSLDGTVRRAAWPPTDDDRRDIMTSTGLTPFNEPQMPRMPRQPHLGI